MAQGNHQQRKRPRAQTAPRQKKRPRPRRRRRGRRTLHHILLVFVLLVAGAVLSLTVFFKIEDIVVNGSEHYPAEDIIAQTGIELEDNLFLVRTSEIEQHLLDTFPYIEEVSVVRTYPPSIEIQLTPSVAVAALEQAEHNYVLITYAGKVLEEGLALPPADALLVQGVSLGEMKPGDVLGEWSKEPVVSGETEDAIKARKARNDERERMAEDQQGVLRMIHYLLGAMEHTGFDDITNIDLSDRYNMKIRYQNRMDIYLGTEIELPYKLSFADRVLHEYLHPEAPGSLDLANVISNRVYYQPAEGYRNDGSSLEDDPYTPLLGEDTTLDDSASGEDALDETTEDTELSPEAAHEAAIAGEIPSHSYVLPEDLEEEDSSEKVLIRLEDLE